MLNFFKSRRVLLRDVKNVFILLPDGLGDLVYWLPVIKFLTHRNRNVSIFYPSSSLVMDPLCGPGQVNTDNVHYVDAIPEQTDLVLMLNDNESQINLFKEQLLNVPVRVGIYGGTHRDKFLTHKIKFRFLKKPRHERDRNLELLSIVDYEHDEAYCNYVNLNLPLESDPGQSSNYVVLHPFSNGHGREWPSSSFVELIEILQNNRIHVYVTGGSGEIGKIDLLLDQLKNSRGVFNLAGALSLRELMNLLGKAKAVVAASTGPLHIAAQLGVPTLGIYAPKKGLNPERWGPLGLNAYAVSLKKCRSSSCSNDECACVKAIKAEDIFDSISQLICGDFPKINRSRKKDIYDIWQGPS